MTHSHDHGTASYSTAFAVGIGLNTAFVVLEVLIGIKANSLALVADAGHNLSDVMALILAWIASLLVQRPPTARRTYGLRRSSVLAALANAALLLVAVGAIVWEAIRRLAHPTTVATGLVMWVAGAGIVINAATAFLFFRGRKSDLNIRGAFLHMVADAGVSAGVVIAAALIAVTGWRWLDPAVSLGIAVVITAGTWGLLRDSVNLALDAVPEEIDPVAVQAFLTGIAGVTALHDLHIWGMSTTHSALTAHLVKPSVEDEDAFLAKVCRELHDRFGIEHATLQIERGDPSACGLASADVV